MKTKIVKLITRALEDACEAGVLARADFSPVEIEVPKIESHGDYSTNIAMVSASIQKMAPRKIAQAIVDRIDDRESIVADTRIEGPGFINFFIRPSAWRPVLDSVHKEDSRYGASSLGQGRSVQVEFVSANPTGPLHVGHGRGAVVGDSVARILSFCGYKVQREYYINDSGRQINTLGRSVFYRYKALHGHKISFPDECYQGEYIRDLARQVMLDKGDALLHLPEIEAVMSCARFGAGKILAGIRADLKQFGVVFDRWFSEQSLYDRNKVDRAIEELKNRDLVYQKDGAFWFRTTAFGDEKDRVVVRKNGQTTYFASDIAYHYDKYERGFERVIDVWGADHHGYIPRVAAAIEAEGNSRNRFDVILVQLVNLLRGGQPVAMSTRSGEFVTLKDVVEEVGRDAARFIFLTRHYDNTLDFDLELAKQKTNDNPVYYVQYVHARITSIIAKAREQGLDAASWQQADRSDLSAPEEIRLIKCMARYPEVVARSAEQMAPHRVTFFLMELAAFFHTYYNKHRVLTDDPILTQGRLYLVTAVQKIIRNGLALLGVSAPERM